jgi:hypothetical protein
VRRSTWLVVAAVGLVALLAGVDSLRNVAAGTAERSPTRTDTDSGVRRVDESGPPVIAARDVLAVKLRRADISGLLFLTDETCRLRVLLLPAAGWLSDTSAPPESCEFSVAPDGREVRFGANVAWSPSGRLSARCLSGGVRIFSRAREVLERLPGLCAPAWRPDGTLTAARGARLVEHSLFCGAGPRACERTLLAEGDLFAALRGGSTPFRPLYAPEIRQAVWLGDTRVALVIRTRVRDQGDSRFDLLAVYEGRRLVAEPVVNVHFDELAASPSRRYMAIHGSAFRGLFFLDRDGRVLARNPVASGHHAAWSPDERWTAVATGGSTYLFRTRDLDRFASVNRPPAIRIPVYAADVDWR